MSRFQHLLYQSINQANGRPVEEVERIVRLLLLFAGVISFVNFINCVFQSIGGTTRELMIESFLLLILAVLFSFSILYTNKKETDCAAATTVTLNFLSLGLLLVMIVHGSYTLYTLISTGASIWIALIVLLVLTLLEFIIRFRLTISCWMCYRNLKEAEANNPSDTVFKQLETNKPLLK